MAHKGTNTAIGRVPATFWVTRVALALALIAMVAGIVGLAVALDAGPRAMAEGKHLAAWVNALWPYRGVEPT